MAGTDDVFAMNPSDPAYGEKLKYAQELGSDPSLSVEERKARFIEKFSPMARPEVDPQAPGAAYQFGQKLKQYAPDIGNAVVNSIPGARPVVDAVSGGYHLATEALPEAVNAIGDVYRGATGKEPLAQSQAYDALQVQQASLPGGPGQNEQNAMAALAQGNAQLQRPQVMYGSRGGSGGGTSAIKGTENKIKADEKKYLAQADEQFARQERIIQENATAGQAQAAKESAYIEQAYQDQQTRQAKFQANESERQFKVKKAVDDAQKAMDDAAGQKQDANHFWNSRTSAEQTQLALAAALIGFSGGMKGDPGAGIRMIQSYIDRDMEAQRENIQTKKDAAQGKMNIAQTMRSMFSDDRQAEAAENAMAWQGVEVMLKKMATDAKSVEVQQRAGELLVQAGQQKLGFMQQLAQATNQAVLSSQVSRANIGLQAEQNDIQREAVRARGGGGEPKQLTEGTIEKLTEIGALRDSFARLGKDFEENTGVFSVLTKHIPGTPSRDYETMRDNVIDMLARARSGGAITDDEEERYRRMIPASQVWNVDAKTKFASLTSELTSKLDTRLQAYRDSGYDTHGVEKATVSQAGSFVPAK